MLPRGICTRSHKVLQKEGARVKKNSHKASLQHTLKAHCSCISFASECSYHVLLFLGEQESLFGTAREKLGETFGSTGDKLMGKAEKTKVCMRLLARPRNASRAESAWSLVRDMSQSVCTLPGTGLPHACFS